MIEMLVRRLSYCCVIGGLALLFGAFQAPTYAYQLQNYSYGTFTVVSPDLDASNMFNNGSGNQGIILMAVRWGILFDDGLGISSISNPDDDGVIVKIIGKPLFYPNPFKLSRGAQLGYRLSRNADVELRIFDMRANQILRTQFRAGTTGGIAGYNRLTMNFITTSGYDLSSGVYFFVLSSGGRVIGKGKFVIVP